MQKDSIRIEQLVAKMQQGEATTQEMEQLIFWYNSHEDSHVNIETAEMLDKNMVKQRMLGGLLSKVREEKRLRHNYLKRRNLFFKVAAVAALFIVAGLLWLGIRYKSLDSVIENQTWSVESVLPGGNKAILTFSDGSQIELDKKQEGIMFNGDLQYTNGEAISSPVDLSTVHELTLSVPKGGTYQVILSDGTEVWLNADSRLTYPSRFSEQNREVELEGEAFFAVNKLVNQDGKFVPFFVKTKGQLVEVLGTAFNVNAYADRAIVSTTLLEGKVNVKVADRQVSLLPGQQANTRGTSLDIRKVNPQSFIAWKDGAFSFDDKSFEEIMQEVGRWYDLSIVYKNKVPKVELIGDAYRNQNIKFVLQLLDASGISYNLDIAKRTLTIN